MGAVAVGQQLNTDSQASAGKERRKDQAPEGRPPFGIKDTTHTRYNAIRHGILAKGVVLAGEDPQEYEDMRMALERDFDAVGMLEGMWVDQLASCYWRLGRLMRAEAEGTTPLETLHRYEVGLRNEMRGIIADLREAQRRRRASYTESLTDPDLGIARDGAEAHHLVAYWARVIRELDTSPDEARAEAERKTEEWAEDLYQDPETGGFRLRCETNSRPGWPESEEPSLDAQVRARLERDGTLMPLDAGN
jgi:hypothetical protein